MAHQSRWMDACCLYFLIAAAGGAGLAALDRGKTTGERVIAIASCAGLSAGAGMLFLLERRHRRVLRDLRALSKLSREPDCPIDPALFPTPEVAALAMLWPSAPVVPPTPPDDTGERPVLVAKVPDEVSGSDLEHPASRPSHALAASDMVGRLEPDTLRWRGATPALALFLGHSVEELSKRTLPDLVHPDDRQLALEQLLAAQAKGEAHGLIYRIVTGSGQTRIMELHIGVRFGDDQRADYLRCRAFDVTARVRASRELRRRTRELTRANVLLREANRALAELTERYGDLYENAPAMYFTLGIDERFELCNKTMMETLGYRAADLIGKPYTRLVTPERLAAIPALREEFNRAGHIEVESRWLTADGRTLSVHVTAAVLRDREGRVIGTQGVARDVTAFKGLEAALRERNANLATAVAELSRKNRELDEFGHGVSHDLQEPLRTLIAFSDFLLKDYGDRLDEDGRQYIRHIVDASRRMRTLIGDLLALSRAGKVTGDFGPVDLEGLLETVRADLAELIRSREGALVVHSPLPTLWGDAPRLGQLLANLVSNGMKYRGERPPVVELGAIHPEDGWTTLMVKDNGIGIDPRFHEKIFQLFRRLHPRDHYEGNGAGLAICRKIAQAHGGSIVVESQLGEGATFLVKLPIAPSTEAEGAFATPEAVHA